MGLRFLGFVLGVSDPGDGVLVDLYKDHSVAPLVDLRRRLRAVLDIVAAIGAFQAFTVSRGLELTRQWSFCCCSWATGVVLPLGDLVRGLWLGFG